MILKERLEYARKPAMLSSSPRMTLRMFSLELRLIQPSTGSVAASEEDLKLLKRPRAALDCSVVMSDNTCLRRTAGERFGDDMMMNAFDGEDVKMLSCSTRKSELIAVNATDFRSVGVVNISGSCCNYVGTNVC